MITKKQRTRRVPPSNQATESHNTAPPSSEVIKPAISNDSNPSASVSGDHTTPGPSSKQTSQSRQSSIIPTRSQSHAKSVSRDNVSEHGHTVNMINVRGQSKLSPVDEGEDQTMHSPTAGSTSTPFDLLPNSNIPPRSATPSSPGPASEDDINWVHDGR